MALSLKDLYAYIVGASASYPWGSFKNDSTGSTGDGTPFEKEWPNDIYGFLQALLTAGEVVPSGVADTAVASQYLQAAEALMWTPADTKFVFRTTPGRRWLEANGGTIGDAASGASERANADTVGLFNYMWSLTPMQLYTDAGAPVARGASAAADWAAHRRIGIPDMRGMTPRGWDHGRGMDPGRVLGSYQEDAMQRITGVLNSASSSSPNVADGAFYVDPGTTANSAGDVSGGEPVTRFDSGLETRVADETRVKNIAGMWIIRY